MLSLPADDFLRRLPAATTTIDRIRLESLVYASDLIANAYQTIHDTGLKTGKIAATPMDRAAMFSSAWTIIDQINAARQLHSGLQRKMNSPTQDRFYEIADIARRLRNKMDHLPQMAVNLASRKGTVSPLFGSLSYILVGDENIQVVNGERKIVRPTTVTHLSGSILAGDVTFKIVNPAGRQIPNKISFVELYAFGEEIQIDDCLIHFYNLMVEVSVDYFSITMAWAQKEAALVGKSVDELLMTIANNLTVCATFLTDAEASEEEAKLGTDPSSVPIHPSE